MSVPNPNQSVCSGTYRDGYRLYQSSWSGVEFEIAHLPARIGNFDHIEIRTDNGGILPVTETGYRSFFFAADHLAEYDGVIAFVQAWIDQEAKSPAWKKMKDTSQQLSLF